MKREVYVGKVMYAIFCSSGSKTMSYVQPCKVLEITKDGFWAECHNGGETGNGLGKEFFNGDTIGESVFFSKDSATVCLERTKI